MSITVLPGGHCLLCHSDYENRDKHHGLAAGRDGYKEAAECSNVGGTSSPCLITCNPKWSYSKVLGRPKGRIIKMDMPLIDVTIEIDRVQSIVKMPLDQIIGHLIAQHDR